MVTYLLDRFLVGLRELRSSESRLRLSSLCLRGDLSRERRLRSFRLLTWRSLESLRSRESFRLRRFDERCLYPPLMLLSEDECRRERLRRASRSSASRELLRRSFLGGDWECFDDRLCLSLLRLRVRSSGSEGFWDLLSWIFSFGIEEVITFSAAVVAVVDVAVGTIVTVRVTTESLGCLDDVIIIC